MEDFSNGSEEEEQLNEEHQQYATQEEREFLELRKELKETFRKKSKGESSTSSEVNPQHKTNPTHDNYGSFFGPSHSCIAPRILAETKEMLKIQSINSFRNRKTRLQKIRESRDYSFLLSDNDQPTLNNSSTQDATKNRPSLATANCRKDIDSYSKNRIGPSGGPKQGLQLKIPGTRKGLLGNAAPVGHRQSSPTTRSTTGRHMRPQKALDQTKGKSTMPKQIPSSSKQPVCDDANRTRGTGKRAGLLGVPKDLQLKMPGTEKKNRITYRAPFGHGTSSSSLHLTTGQHAPQRSDGIKMKGEINSVKNRCCQNQLSAMEQQQKTLHQIKGKSTMPIKMFSSLKHLVCDPPSTRDATTRPSYTENRVGLPRLPKGLQLKVSGATEKNAASVGCRIPSSTLRLQTGKQVKQQNNGITKKGVVMNAAPVGHRTSTLHLATGQQATQQSYGGKKKSLLVIPGRPFSLGPSSAMGQPVRQKKVFRPIKCQFTMPKEIPSSSQQPVCYDSKDKATKQKPGMKGQLIEGRELFVPKKEKMMSTQQQTSLEKQNWAMKKGLSMQGPKKLQPSKDLVKHQRQGHVGEGCSNYSSIIRKIFNYDPAKFEDDGDDYKMESSFADIQKEERKSAKLGRKEDEVERIRNEEEERQERLQREAKKRKRED